MSATFHDALVVSVWREYWCEEGRQEGGTTESWDGGSEGKRIERWTGEDGRRKEKWKERGN